MNGTQVKERKYAGRLQNFIHEWRKITKSLTVLQWVKGVNIPFNRTPFQKHFKKVQITNSEIPVYKTQIDRLLQMGAISGCKLKLNLFIEAPHFKIEDYRSVTKLLTKNIYLANIDLKDAYYLISIDKKYRKYLRYAFQSRLYESVVFPSD
nr:unnamed protein product [Callosobruchus chinensis]